MSLSILGKLRPSTRRLLQCRTLRSIGQGALAVDLVLYLHALGWSGVAIGLVLTGAGLFGATLSLLIGPTSDRLRRKPFLLACEVLTLLAALTALVSAHPVALAGAIIVGGFGRGANGAAGPFSPAEQAWLAEEVAPHQRGQVFSLNTALGFFGMGLGALLATLPAVWGNWHDGNASAGMVSALAYRPLFAVVGLAAVACLWLLAHAPEHYRGEIRDMHDLRGQIQELQTHDQENLILQKLVLINGTLGFAVGLTGPLIAYWFALRFHVGPSAIAPVMAAAFGLTGVLSLLTGKLTERIGLVRAVFWERLIGLVLLVLLPLMPTYPLAALVYLLRTVFNRGPAGAQQALTVGLVREERRGLAASLNAVSFQLPRTIGPSIAGYLLDAGLFAAPFYAAAVLQGLYLVTYRRVFQDYEPPPEDSARLQTLKEVSR